MSPLAVLGRGYAIVEGPDGHIRASVATLKTGEHVRVRMRDGVELSADIYRPDAEGKFPALLLRTPYSNNTTGGVDQSKFFAERGHHQVIAGYYDHKPEQIAEWLSAAKPFSGIDGVMYTTWQHKYDDLEAFARLCKD